MTSSALKGGFAEAEALTVTLEDDSVQDFRTFLEWMYTKHITTRVSGLVELSGDEEESDADHETDAQSVVSSDTTPDNNRTEISRLVDLYIFADRRGVSELRNDVVTRLIAETDLGECEWPSNNVELVTHAYHHLPASSTLLRYLVAEAAWWWEEEELAKPELETFPSTFLAQVLRMWPKSDEKRKQDGYRPWRGVLYRFHEHRNKQSGKDCKKRNAELQKELRSLMQETKPTSAQKAAQSCRQSVSQSSRPIRD
ncbi:hypothetical protein LTR37_001377 [Vermiconidia calcicola]|uniref:Uncharacterized protein n=1 Tax=Vermiconidia calcicola TaxID=1690605 RepID=A0ACC3NVE5_9PEZI|nr:hypothetical protein LTR37_001377 [Vermiconidia calcicola]